MVSPHLDHRVDPTKSDHVFEYTKHSYHLNDILFYKDQPSEADDQMIKKLQEALRIPAKYKFNVFSGLKWSPSDIWERECVDPTSNLRIHLPAFTSTSTEFSIAVGFCRSLPKPDPEFFKFDRKSKNIYDKNDDALHVLEFTVTPGTEIGSVMHISKFRNEYEMILNSGTDIEISPNPKLLSAEDGNLVVLWSAVCI